MNSCWVVAALMLGQPAMPDPGAAPAAAANVPLPAPMSPAEVLRGFVERLSGGTEYPPQAVEFIRSQYEARRGGDNLASLLDEALAVLSADFKAGLDAMAADQADAALGKFDALTRSADPYVAVNAAFFATQAYIGRENLRDAGHVLDEAFRQHSPISKYTVHTDHMLFLLAYAQAHTLQYDRARQTLEHFLKQFPSAPERYRSTAQQILTELEHRSPGMIGDVYDLMTYSRRELTVGRTDGEVSRRQDEAVKLLEKLIKEAEDEENKKGGGGKGGKGGSRSRRMPRNQQSQAPRQQSELNPSGGADKDLNRGRQASPGDAWGNMPPRQRDQILQALQKQFPSQYRDLVEQYYRQVAKDSQRP